MDNQKINEVAQDVKEIKSQVMELVKQGAIMNVTLIEHERRSTNLETRLKPIEDNHVFVRKLAAVMVAVCGAAGTITSIYKLLK